MDTKTPPSRLEEQASAMHQMLRDIDVEFNTYIKMEPSTELQGLSPAELIFSMLLCLSSASKL
jgi:hypothetical protein